ncbi:MAG: hypothetical protein AAGG48_28565 [Planctomycetota bacterium]
MPERVPKKMTPIWFRVLGALLGAIVGSILSALLVFFFELDFGMGWIVYLVAPAFGLIIGSIVGFFLPKEPIEFMIELFFESK